MQNEYRPGEKVRLQLGVEGNRLSPSGLKRWDECIFTVKCKKVLAFSSNNRYTYYELKSCKSPMGVPYAIMEEWLVPIK